MPKTRRLLVCGHMVLVQIIISWFFFLENRFFFNNRILSSLDRDASNIGRAILVSAPVHMAL